MAKLTISVDSEVLRRARIRALELGVSVNGVLADFLEVFSGAQECRKDAASRLNALSLTSNSRRDSVRWDREELHERR